MILKKILFVMTHLNNGGITSSFLNLLTELSQNNNLKIDVLLFNHDLKNKLPSGINLLPENKFLRLIAITQHKIYNESKILWLFRCFLGLLTKIVGSSISYRIIFFTYKKMNTYDYAISFTQSAHKNSLYGGCNEFVLDKVNAKCKITFIHCDYVMTKLNTKYNSKLYSKFDKIAAVSDGVKKVFVTEEPHLKSKVYTVHNCHNYNKIIKLSNENTVIYDTSRINILTVARISPEKGYIRMLNVLKKLKNLGYDFRWHIVGGAERKKEDNFIDVVKKANMENNVFVYHNTDNPYRYYPNADVMLLASFHEAAPMVFSEAECLNIPIITTNTLSAKEFVLDKGLGIVCPNCEDGIFNALKTVMDNPLILKKFRSQIKNLSYPTNEKALNEFNNLIDE